MRKEKFASEIFIFRHARAYVATQNELLICMQRDAKPAMDQQVQG
jgi:hypothetical protein